MNNPVTHIELINMTLQPLRRAIRRFFLTHALKWEYRYLELAAQEAARVREAQRAHAERIINLQAELGDLK